MVSVCVPVAALLEMPLAKVRRLLELLASVWLELVVTSTLAAGSPMVTVPAPEFTVIEPVKASTLLAGEPDDPPNRVVAPVLAKVKPAADWLPFR